MVQEDSVSDKQLVGWLRRVLPALQGCQPVSLRYLLEELAGEPRSLRGILYGLVRLKNAVLVKKSIGFFDYAAIVLTVSRAEAGTAEAMARDLTQYVDSGDIPASELSYHIYWTLVPPR